MPPPLMISIPHRVGKDEATRRIKSGIASAKEKFGQLFTIERETWTGNHLDFTFKALGQEASGSIDVAEDHARLEVMLPWPLAHIASAIQRTVQQQGTRLLEKK
jgi:hypothetical protein